jgi:hypothetical protein
MRLNTVEFLSFGEDRIYAKEQSLIDLLKEELTNNRPCVVYLRQTATKDIQPRIEKLIRQHVPDAVPYILKNTVQAERREKVIEGQISAGVNVVICNPELVKTGLDLIHFPTLIFYEITFNLGTMMQAAARSYRLNQTHQHCKTYYLFAEGTMEHTAVQLMSRKQRAAKLLTGDIGLTGLDSLTEGESGFEEALLDAIAKEDTLVNPSEMFKISAGQSEIDAEDAAYWNVEIVADEPTPFVLSDISSEPMPLIKPTHTNDQARLTRYVSSYLERVHLIYDDTQRAELQTQLFSVLLDGVLEGEGTDPMMGLRDSEFMKYPHHAKKLTRYIEDWLKQHQFVFVGCEQETAVQIVDLAQQALGLKPVQLDIFQTMATHDDPTSTHRPKATAPKRPLASKCQEDDSAPVQLALF